MNTCASGESSGAQIMFSFLLSFAGQAFTQIAFDRGVCCCCCLSLATTTTTKLESFAVKLIAQRSMFAQFRVRNKFNGLGLWVIVVVAEFSMMDIGVLVVVVVSRWTFDGARLD